MSESFEYKGYWFLPSDPQNKVAGILKHTPNKSIKLELIGSLEKSDNNSFPFLERKKLDIIQGITSNAKEITLINCHPDGGSFNFSSTFPITKFSAQYCLKGIYISSLEEKRFNWGYITFPELSAWCHPAALNTVYEFGDKDEINKISISLETDEISKPIISVKVNDSTTLSLKRNVIYNGSFDHLNPTIQQNTQLKIQKQQKSSISNFLSDIHLFEKFISLAQLSKTEVSSITLFDENNYQESHKNKKHDHPIELFYAQRETKRDIKKHDFLFSFSQIEDIFPNIIRKWYDDIPEIAPIRSHLIRSIGFKTYFDSTDFLIVIQAIEGFSTRFRIKKTLLANRLKLLLEEFEDVDLIKYADIDIRATIHSRNYYSHFMHKKPHTLDSLELYYLTKKLRVLLICCLLNFIGIENEKINELLNKSNSYMLK